MPDIGRVAGKEYGKEKTLMLGKIEGRRRRRRQRMRRLDGKLEIELPYDPASPTAGHTHGGNQN